MSVNFYTHQAANIRKTWFLMTVFFIVIMGIGWLFSQTTGNPAILYFAVIFSLAMNIISYWQSDKIALAMAGAVAASEGDYPDLHNVLENLAIAAGLPKPRIYIINDPAPNAFATGRDKDHAAVAVTTGLLSILDRSELEGVLAHELSHIGNRDILVSTVVVVLVGFVAIISDIFLRSQLWGGHGRDRDSRSGGALMLVGLLLSILAPLIATLIQLAISRRREFLADASGALLTRYPEGLASALRKINQSGAPLRRASRATAHLFISNPFGSRAARGLSKLFLTHPPGEERVTALLGQVASNHGRG